MNEEEKVKFIDQFLLALNNTDFGTVPEFFLGFNKVPPSNSLEDRKFRIIENELINLGLAKKLRGGDNSTIGGYMELEILPKGMELVISGLSVSNLYKEIREQSDQDKKIKELTIENFQYKQALREQEQRILDLTEKTKIIDLVKGYRWVFTILIVPVLYGFIKWISSIL